MLAATWRKARLVAAAFLVVLVALAPAQAQSGADAAAAREIVKRWQDSIVSVRVVLKTGIVVGGREMQSAEETIETVAAVVDPSGLALLSLASLNPGEMMSKIMGQAGGRAPGTPEVQFTSEPSDLRIRLADGQEVPATIVLRDADLDLAFIRPTSPLDTPLRAIDLTESAQPALLESVVVLSRLGRVGGWTPAASLRQVHAIVERPRTLYVTEAGSQFGGMGTPVFLLDGKLVGFLVLRSTAGGRPGMFAAMGGAEGLGMLPVILPAADVREVAAQAMEKR
jgi:hypothetical protein